MEQRSRDRLARNTAGALLWIAAFCFAVAFFLPVTKLLRALPPTEPLAIGRVTIEGASKMRDYLGAALYFAFVPLLAFVARPLLERYHRRIAPRQARGERLVLSTLLFSIPFILAPLLFLTTRKEQWGILLPPLLAALGPLSLAAAAKRRWVRELFAPAVAPVHALLLTEAAAWILFRYLATGTRIAHVPTLFLEVPFALLFVGAFWGAALLVARSWALSSFGSLRTNLSSIAFAASPLLILPLLALGSLDLRRSATIVWIAVATGAVLLLAFRRRETFHPRIVRAGVTWVAVPLLLFVIGWTSIANSLRWVDLFHRGEALAPAAEYLAGEVPYRDVFILHGLMDDGMLDAWLMRWAGADIRVMNHRIVAMSALALVALWILAFLLFDSLPLSLVVVALGMMTFVENARALLELSVLALLFAGLWRGSRVATFAAGVASAVTLFYSIDIGLYSLAGSVAGILGWTLWRSRSAIEPPHRSIAALPWYLAGLVAGAAPFLFWLAAAGVLTAFFRVSFVEVPRFIDPVWSLPFPDLASFFQSGLQIRSIADFLLGERSRFLLNPIVLGAALLALVVRFASRKAPEKIDLALLLLASFGVVTQRSALGRADFPHQYFSAFVIAPTLVALVVLLGRAASRIWRDEGAAGRILLASVPLVSLPLLAALLWIPDLIAARLDSIVYFRAQRSPAWHDPAAAVVEERIEAVSAEIRRTTSPTDPIFDFSNQPAFYFFSGRRNPTRFFQIPMASAPRFQMEILADLERTRPPVILRKSPQSFDRFDAIPNDLRAQAIAAYVDSLYEHARTVRGVEIWTRKAGAQAGDLARFSRLISMPSPSMLASPERVVIPAVASARGAAGAEWVSDLVVQNPGDRPVELRLRYASSRGTRDRTITLAPRELRTEADFPRTLFSLGESVGALWVTYPADQKPILFALTHDRARGGTPSRSEPLSASDAAEAGTGAGALRIVGARSGGTRRANLGVVNIGITPARVRVHATTADGSPTGAALEWEIAEEDSWLLGNVESRLGVELDGSVVIHVTMLGGRAVGYASVVDGATGIHELLPAFPSPAAH